MESDSCDAGTWKVISNSLYIDYIRGHIRGRLAQANSTWNIEVTHYVQIPLCEAFSADQGISLTKDK